MPEYPTGLKSKAMQKKERQQFSPLEAWSGPKQSYGHFLAARIRQRIGHCRSPVPETAMCNPADALLIDMCDG
jgi:hypothetical protein